MLILKERCRKSKYQKAEKKGYNKNKKELKLLKLSCRQIHVELLKPIMTVNKVKFWGLRKRNHFGNFNWLIKKSPLNCNAAERRKKVVIKMIPVSEIKLSHEK